MQSIDTWVLITSTYSAAEATPYSLWYYSSYSAYCACTLPEIAELALALNMKSSNQINIWIT